MWTSRSEEINGGLGLRFVLNLNSAQATFADVISGWQSDRDFRTFFTALLAESPFLAFRWETPAVASATVSQPFEFVLLNSPGLARSPEPQAFAEHFAQSQEEIVTFPNLGGDAIMVVPRPLAESSAYGHLAAFVRLAPDNQKHKLWQAVSAAMMQRISTKPVWLSTAGAGVSWLHVRIDDRPKYFGFGPYRQPT